MEEPAGADVRYTAFLSYSHKDAAAAARLHRRLESYRVPKRLIGTQTPRGPVAARLWPIFRDREELPAASDLSETVRIALAQSGALIILCSPAAAGSLWVAEEIETFRKLHPDRPILAAILAGDPPDCFPAALRAFGQDGTWHEPLATDLRPGKDGKHLGLLKLVAGITGIGLDDLVQRDAARRIRRVMAVTAAAVIAMLIMTALAVVALQARREADRQRAEAEGLIEFMLTDLRTRLRGSVGQLRVMAVANRRALQYYGEQNELEGLSPESLDRRARILHAIGEDDLHLGDDRSALAAFREAYRATAEQLARAPRNAELIFAHSQSEYWLGLVPYQHGDFRAARRHWANYKDLVDRLVTLDPNNPRWLKEAGYADGNLCTIAMGPPIDAATALGICRSSLRNMLRARALQPADQSLVEALANRHAWLVDVWSVAGNWGRAMEHRREHEALVQELLRSDPNNFDYLDIWVRSQLGFGELLARRGDQNAARQQLRGAASDLAVLLAHDSANESWRQLRQRIDRDLQQGDSHD